MKANELRIGNYVNGLYNQEIDRGNGIIEDVESYETVKIVGLDSVGFSEYSIWVEDGSRDVYESFEPIPLTEEWLLKFGFEKTERGDAHVISVGEYDLYVVVNAFSGSLKKDPHWFCSVSTGYGSQPMSITKMYVHQLQNLYFALIGEELTIKP